MNKTGKIPVNVVLRINKIQFTANPKEAAVGKFWVKAIIKRGSHTQKTNGYQCSQVYGQKNCFDSDIPDNEKYAQPGSLFEVETRIDEKTTIWKPKKASYEIQYSAKSDKDKFVKLHAFEIDMAHYVNQNIDVVDYLNPSQMYVHKKNVLFDNEKTGLKCWMDIILGDPKYENQMLDKRRQSIQVDRMDDLF